jgi:hypothetical protein
MKSNWPAAVIEFEAFLKNAGLECKAFKEYASFGDKMLLYSNASIGVRIVSERGICFVEVSDIASRSGEWYDAAILRDVLSGPGDDVLPLEDQIGIVKSAWSDLNSIFAPQNRNETHLRLEILRKERARRRFPGLYP